MFLKQFRTFAEGINALVAVSNSVSDVFGQSYCPKASLDLSDEAEVRAWLSRCSMYRGTGNGVGWDIELFCSPFGVAYRTKGGLVFGWVYSPGYHGESADAPVCFIDRPQCKEVPEGGSSLYRRVQGDGWTPVDPGSYNPFNIEGEVINFARKVGWKVKVEV